MKIRAILTSVCLCAFVLPLAAAPPLAERLPSGTLVYLGWSGQTEAFDASVLGQFLDEPVCAKIVSAIKNAAAMQMGGDEGEMFAKAWSMARIAWKHPAAAALIDLKQSDGPPMPSAVLLIDLGADKEAFAEQLDALLALLGDKLPPCTEQQIGDASFKRFDIHGKLAAFVGYVDTVFFAAVGEALPGQLIVRTPGASLKSNAKFVKCIRAVGGPDEQLALYVDVTALIAKVEPMIAAMSGTQPASGPAGESELRRVIAALGVGKVTAIAACVRFVDKGMHTRTRIFSPAPHLGLLMPFAGVPLDEADLAAIPQDADLFVAVNLSPAALYAEIRRVVNDISPDADSQIARGIASMEEQLGFSLSDDLLASLGDTWVLSSAPSQGGFLTGTLLTVDVKDAEKLSAVVAKLEAIVTKQFGPQDPEGPGPHWRRRKAVTIEAVKVGQAEIHYAAIAGLPIPVAPAWAIHEGKFYLAGWPQVIESVIGKGPVQPITQDATFRRFRARISGKPSALAYVNTPSILRQSYNVILVVWSMAANMIPGETGIAAKPDWLPALPKMEKYLWPQISAVSADAEGITFEGYGSLPGMNLLAMPLATPLGMSVLLPSLGRSRELAKKVSSAANLNGIGKSILLYRADNNDESPPDLAALVKAKFMTSSMLVSPVSGRAMPTDADGMPIGESDYVYLRLGDNADAGLIMAYERLENYGGRGTNVLFAGYNVAWVDRPNFDRLLKKTEDYLKNKKIK